MAWIAKDVRAAQIVEQGKTFLTDDIRQTLEEKYLPRYPIRRAALLPALHLMMHEYNWIPPQALQEVAEFIGISPAEAMDTASFYEEFWLKPKGQYLISVCRSLACELCQSQGLIDHLETRLGIDSGETTPDGKFTLFPLECLGACGTAPVMLINDVLHENLTTETVDQLIAALPDKASDYHDPTVTWDAGH